MGGRPSCATIPIANAAIDTGGAVHFVKNFLKDRNEVAMLTKTLKHSTPFRRSVAAMLLLLFVLALAMPGVAGAQTTPQSQAATAGQNTVSASGDPQISLPTGATMEKQSDLTAAMLFRLFGSPWTTITGNTGATVSNGIPANSADFFSGIILNIFGAMNLGAMFFVGIAIAYMWGMFAVTTAHEGQKLGGSLYNSLWVPVRHVFSFTLTIPMLNGLSLLQVALLAMVSLGINFANSIYDNAGAFIIQKEQTNTADIASSMLSTEAYQMLPLMFQSAVIQEAVKGSNNGNITWSTKLPVGTSEATPYQKGYFASNQAYFLLDNKLDGTTTVYATPIDGIGLDGTNGVIIPNPGVRLSQPSGMQQNYLNTMNTIANSRIEAVQTLWDAVRKEADAYLCSAPPTSSTPLLPSTYGGCAGAASNPAGLAAAVQAYVTKVSGDTKTAVQQYTQDPSNPAQLSKLIDSVNGKSQQGWASAGLFSFAIASFQQNVDDLVYQQVGYQYESEIKSDVEHPGHWFWANGYHDLSDDMKKAILNSPHYFTTNVLQGTSYAALSYEQGANDTGGGFFKSLSRGIISILTGVSSDSSGSHQSLLNTVLNKAATYDPIVIISSMGHRFLAVSGWSAALAAGSNFISAGLSYIPFIGSGLAKAASSFLPLLWSLVGTFFLLGILCAYVAPIIPVVVWVRALFGWIFLVVESLIAAPFWAVTHSLPEGAGFAGNHARQGYLMAVDIVIRPVILTASVLIAIALAQIAGWFFATLLSSWLVNAGSTSAFSWVADIVFSIIVLGVIYYVYFTIFTQGVLHLPEHISRWLGSGVPSLGGEHEAGQQMNILVGKAFNQAGGLGSGVGKAISGFGPKGKRPPADPNDPTTKMNNSLTQIARNTAKDTPPDDTPPDDFPPDDPPGGGGGGLAEAGTETGAAEAGASAAGPEAAGAMEARKVTKDYDADAALNKWNNATGSGEAAAEASAAGHRAGSKAGAASGEAAGRNAAAMGGSGTSNIAGSGEIPPVA